MWFLLFIFIDFWTRLLNHSNIIPNYEKWMQYCSILHAYHFHTDIVRIISTKKNDLELRLYFVHVRTVNRFTWGNRPSETSHNNNQSLLRIEVTIIEKNQSTTYRSLTSIENWAKQTINSTLLCAKLTEINRKTRFVLNAS